MASPQREKGFTPIANELLEVLARVELSGTQLALILAVMRKTYGFNKKEDAISIDQFIEMLKVSRRTVIYTLQDLEAKNIILVRRSRSGEKNNVNVVRFNKDYDTWIVSVSAPQVDKNRSSAKLRKQISSAKPEQLVVQNSVKNIPSFAPTKETIQKKTKETGREGNFNPLGAEIIKAFELVDPKNKQYYGNTTQREACDFLIQEYGLQIVLDRIAILPQTNTIQYFPTVTTPAQLRDKWVQLESAAKRKQTELSKSTVAFS